MRQILHIAAIVVYGAGLLALLALALMMFIVISTFSHFNLKWV